MSALLALVLLLPAPAVAAPQVQTVALAAFAPEHTTVPQGSRLYLVNADLPYESGYHNMAEMRDEPRFYSEVVGFGQPAEVTGVESLSAGTYDFWCSVHPSTMRGTLTVTALQLTRA